MPPRAPRAGAPVRVGLISDTHGLLRPEAIEALRGCAAIVHAGDIGSAAILQALQALAPVTAVRGNNDTQSWAREIPDTARVEIAGVRILVVHDVKELDARGAGAQADVVIAGHSHRAVVERRDDFLLVNPGSAGPRRFTLPVTVGYLDVASRAAIASIVPLAIATPPSRRPARTRAARRGSAPPPSRSPRR